MTTHRYKISRHHLTETNLSASDSQNIHILSTTSKVSSVTLFDDAGEYATVCLDHKGCIVLAPLYNKVDGVYMRNPIFFKIMPIINHLVEINKILNDEDTTDVQFDNAMSSLTELRLEAQELKFYDDHSDLFWKIAEILSKTKLTLDELFSKLDHGSFASPSKDDKDSNTTIPMWSKTLKLLPVMLQRKSDNLTNPNKTRYVLKKEIGRGVYGTVFSGVDTHTNKEVAIKVSKCIDDERITQSFENEYEYLNVMSLQPKFSDASIVHIHDRFICTSLLLTLSPQCTDDIDESWNKNHMCMVMQLAQSNLYSAYYEQPLDMQELQIMTNCLVRSLKFINDPVVSGLEYPLIHADLKPQNVLITRLPNTNKIDKILLADFGNAMYVKSSNGLIDSKYCQTRFYRAPEIILSLSFGTPIDMWSLGCLLFEVACGQALFVARNINELFLEQVYLLGYPPIEMLSEQRASTSSYAHSNKNNSNQQGQEQQQQQQLVICTLPKYNDTKDNNNNNSKTSNQSFGPFANVNVDIYQSLPIIYLSEEDVVKNLEKKFLSTIRGLYLMSRDSTDDNSSVRKLLKLIAKMLTWSPSKRITPEAALLEPFLFHIIV